MSASESNIFRILGLDPENCSREEVEKALQGQQSAQQTLDTAVQRGNRVLRDFQKSVGG